MKKFALPFLLLFALSSIALHAQPFGKKILVEKVTSAGCPSCPNGDLVLHSYVDNDTNLIPVAIHVNNQGHVDRMFSVDGDSILADYLWAHPTLMVDRYKYSGNQYVAATSGNWGTMISDRKAQPMIGTIGGSTTYNPGDRSLQVHLDGSILWDLTWDLRVNAYIVENGVTGTGLGYDQLNGNNNTSGHPLQGLGDPIVGYVHNWVLRDMLGGPFGAPAFPNPIPTGHAYNYDFTTTLDSAIDAGQAYVILVLQRYSPDKLQREVLNVAKLGLNGAILAGVDAPEQQPLMSIWPNPADEHVHVQVGESANWTATAYDVQGRKQLQSTFTGDRTEINTSLLTPGIYLLRLDAPGKTAVTQKLSIR